MKMERDALNHLVLREATDPVFFETVQGGLLEIQMHGNAFSLTAHPSFSKCESKDIEIDMRSGEIFDENGCVREA